jgi:predicted amidophosphoribosyltransferase
MNILDQMDEVFKCLEPVLTCSECGAKEYEKNTFRVFQDELYCPKCFEEYLEECECGEVIEKGQGLCEECKEREEKEAEEEAQDWARAKKHFHTFGTYPRD